jgi:hypothetical protein
VYNWNRPFNDQNVAYHKARHREDIELNRAWPFGTARRDVVTVGPARSPARLTALSALSRSRQIRFDELSPQSRQTWLLNRDSRPNNASILPKAPTVRTFWSGPVTSRARERQICPLICSTISARVGCSFPYGQNINPTLRHATHVPLGGVWPRRYQITIDCATSAGDV